MAVKLPFHHVVQSDEAEIRARAYEVAAEALRPQAFDDDRLCRFRREAYQALGAAGLTSVSVPKEYGGRGLSYRCYYGVIEEIARASAATAVSVGVTNLVQGALINYGTEVQKKKYLPGLASGTLIAAFSLSESGSGSDAAALKCAAVKKDDKYLITGTKMWCSTAGQADLYLLMARTGTARTKGITSFLIEPSYPGFRVGKQEKKMGLKASPLAELVFENCEVPESQRIGKEGEGFKVALSQLDAGRISIGAVGTGLATESLEIAIQSGVGPDALEYLADRYAGLQALRLMVREAAERRDRKESLTALASMCKLMGSDLAMQTTSDVITLLGLQAATPHFAVERMFRDAKALQIVEGTNQIQRSLLARAMAEPLNAKSKSS